MNDDEVRAAVERIAQLEQDFDSLVDSNPHAANVCFHEQGLYEKALESNGYVLGDEGADIIVYPLDNLRRAKDAWIVYNRSSKTWRQAAPQV